MEKLQREYRVRINENQGSIKVHLPPELILEVGYEGGRGNNYPMVAWYHQLSADKAVLSNLEIDRPSLEFVTATRLHDFDKDVLAAEDIDAGDIDGARTTIPRELEESVYTPLSQSEVAVLKPIPKNLDPSLQYTCVSVYPRREYDRGDLPTVSVDQTVKAGSDTFENDEVGFETSFADSV